MKSQLLPFIQTWRAPLVLAGVVALLTLLLPVMAPFDHRLTVLIGTLPSAVTPFMTAVSSVGLGTPLVILGATVALGEALHQRYFHAAIILASLLSLPAFYALKQLVRRARPVTDFVRDTGLHDYSFPSGHSTASMAVYGVLAYMALQDLPHPWNYVVCGALVFLIFFIGISRVYLGAHFPSDVLGGWLVGLIIISILVTLTRLHDA